MENANMKKDSLSLFFLILIFALTINFKTNTVAEGWADTKEFGPFLCYSQFSLDSIQNELHELHELQNRICSQLHLPAPKQQIELYFFKDAASWTAWHKQHLPDTPLRRALFIKPDVIIQSDKTRAQVFTYYSPQLAQDLRHEGTHAILHTIVGKPIPIWLDEGLAEYYEQDEKIPAVAKAPSFKETRKDSDHGQHDCRRVRGRLGLDRLSFGRAAESEAHSPGIYSGFSEKTLLFLHLFQSRQSPSESRRGPGPVHQRHGTPGRIRHDRFLSSNIFPVGS